MPRGSGSNSSSSSGTNSQGKYNVAHRSNFFRILPVTTMFGCHWWTKPVLYFEPIILTKLFRRCFFLLLLPPLDILQQEIIILRLVEPTRTLDRRTIVSTKNVYFSSEDDDDKEEVYLCLALSVCMSAFSSSSLEHFVFQISRSFSLIHFPCALMSMI